MGTAGLSAAAAASGPLASAKAAPANAKPLTTRVYTSDDRGFSVTSTLTMGEKEAFPVDNQFSFDNAHRLVADVLQEGEAVTQIYVSHAHPAHYFGLAVARAAFPQGSIEATPATVEGIERMAPGKLAQWRPQLGINGPTKAVIP